MPPLRPILPRLPTPPSDAPSRINRLALYLAFFVAMATLPFTIKFQTHRALTHMRDHQWRMASMHDVTGSEAVKRLGKPVQIRDYSLSEGSFAGPELGLKHYYRKDSPEYTERMKSPVVWSFPQYSMVREMIWKLPDSYLTLWLHEPRAEITLGADSSDVTLPTTADGEWVALDNYRVGDDLVKNKPVFK